jgi:carboxypeptidase C (cathepsin A)
LISCTASALVHAAPQTTSGAQTPAQQTPAEQKPAEQKPAEQKPAEQKPAEPKPPEPKPAESKPAETPVTPPVKPQEPAAQPTNPQTPAAAHADDKSASAKDATKDDHSVTHHSVTIEGAKIDYTVRAGRLALQTEAGKRKADVFFVAYTRDGVADVGKRPILFSFNGGPGSSSVWLHLGTIGPRRVHLEPEGWAPPPPYTLVDNPDSWLDFADIVFIDPVTTGYSRAAEGENDDQFHGVNEDVKWVAEFIRLYTTRYERWASPKFLAGESYGTTRAAGLAGELQEHHGMYLNGIVLVSSILNFQTAEFDAGNDLPYALFLPTYTATAWYHKRLAPELQGDLRATLEEVEHFALGEYLVALARGDAVVGEERERLVAKLGRYTGLSLDYIDRANMRIEIGRFTKELLRDERRTAGRLDSRFRGMDVDAVGEHYEYDPSYAAIQGPFTATINNYLRGELGYTNDLPYEILTGRVHPWKMDAENRYVNVGETLRQAMTQNPHLKVFVACGYYDLATPYFAADYTFHHLGLDPSLRTNVVINRYEGGHMMYISDAARAQLRKDVAGFVKSALPQ